MVASFNAASKIFAAASASPLPLNETWAKPARQRQRRECRRVLSLPDVIT